MTKKIIYKIICPNKGKEWCEGTFIKGEYNRYKPSLTKYCPSCWDRYNRLKKEEENNDNTNTQL